MVVPDSMSSLLMVSALAVSALALRTTAQLSRASWQQLGETREESVLHTRGYTNVRHYAGGKQEWVAAGSSVERGA